jgi:hypothetical protein
MKSNLLKIVSVIMAITLVVCSFASCNVAFKEEEQVIKPTVATPSGDNTLPNTDNNMNVNPDMPNLDGTNPGGNSGTIPGEPSGGTTGGTGTGGTGSGVGNIPQIDWEGTYEDIQAATTPEKMREYLHMAGYEYDAKQQIFYTHLNPWQRQMGFTDGYDLAAPLTNM